MNEFARRLNSTEAEAEFDRLLPKIAAMAEHVVARVKQMVSDPCYVGSRTLTVTWLPSRKLQANASVRPPNHHHINIAYGLVAYVYKDAALLYRICSEHLREERYAELLSGIAYDEESDRALPFDLDPVEARAKLFTSGIAWTYLHEQAHLFQAHGPIYAIRLGLPNLFSNTEWVDEPSDSELNGEAAWIKHCFELSADYEASVHSVGYWLVEDQGMLQRSSLWNLVAAITCLFRHFYGDARAPITGVAVGSHPDPTLRFKVCSAAIRDTLWHPQLRHHVPWAATPEDIDKLMRHAFIVSSLYMQIAHLDNEVFPEFLTRIAEQTLEDESYLRGLRDTWASLRPAVVEAYFGPNPENVLPEFESRTLGAV